VKKVLSLWTNRGSINLINFKFLPKFCRALLCGQKSCSLCDVLWCSLVVYSSSLISSRFQHKTNQSSILCLYFNYFKLLPAMHNSCFCIMLFFIKGPTNERHKSDKSLTCWWYTIVWPSCVLKMWKGNNSSVYSLAICKIYLMIISMPNEALTITPSMWYWELLICYYQRKWPIPSIVSSYCYTGEQYSPVH